MAVLNVKTLLVEYITPRGKPRIDEVKDIAKATGYDVVGQVTQHLILIRRRPRKRNRDGISLRTGLRLELLLYRVEYGSSDANHS
jgi:hypothetical protein